jgi:hypothetical protein
MINLIKKIFGLKKTKTITPAVSTPKPVLAEVKAEPKPSVKPVSPVKDTNCQKAWQTKGARFFFCQEASC